MSVRGIDEITWGVEDIGECRKFFLDWGLTLIEEQPQRVVFETLNGCRVILADINSSSLPPAIEPGSTLREVIWGIDANDSLSRYAEKIAVRPGFYHSEERVGCTDPNGLAIGFQHQRKRGIVLDVCSSHNTWNHKGRINSPNPIYERATPIEVGHVVFFVADVEACERFYRECFGFVLSDSYPKKGAFLRTAEEGGHHDIFFLQLPERRVGLNHVAFTVRDIHEVFGGGMHISRCGWQTALGPGRHPVSSAFFWYFKNPAGALVEYYSDEDELTGEWQPRIFEPGPTVFAEWAIAGGIDGVTRRQHQAHKPAGVKIPEKQS
ncbi:VOC family protein [Enterobacter hormaechei]|uniref:VOC family protein n=1 Tax=Enterobacter hormaechei TaxID=158836 RepID=UPI00294A71A9|nr:VOC family protein [Enterobacter hormaechei]MDV5373158.1 VOC family protein [Enterobacter hormaechei]